MNLPCGGHVDARQEPMGPVLFCADGYAVRELGPADVPRVQALFDANPDYFQAVNGRLPRPGEAQEEFDERPPAPFSYTRRWFAGVMDPRGELAGLVIVVSDLCAQAVWHLALFLVATPLRGTGVAPALHAALERWMRDAGAQWVRLNVVVGNTVAERFWARLGYEPVRTRDNIDTGGRINTVRVMVKRLCGRPIQDYLALVPRDRPDADRA
jgi:GNAT superfamily N-acetyltransferase